MSTEGEWAVARGRLASHNLIENRMYFITSIKNIFLELSISLDNSSLEADVL